MLDGAGPELSDLDSDFVSDLDSGAAGFESDEPPESDLDSDFLSDDALSEEALSDEALSDFDSPALESAFLGPAAPPLA